MEEMNEVMTNEEVAEEVGTEIEAVGDAVKNPNEKLQMALLGGAAVLIGGLAVKYVVVPIAAKIRAKKKKKGWDAKEPIDVEYKIVSDDEADKDF